MRRVGREVGGMQKQATLAWQAPTNGSPLGDEQGISIKQKISQWEGRSRTATGVKSHPPAVSRTLSAEVLGDRLCGNDAQRAPPGKASLSKTKSLGLDFRETQALEKPETVGRRSEPLQSYTRGLSSPAILENEPLAAPFQAPPKNDTHTTNPSGKRINMATDGDQRTASGLDGGVVPKPDRPSIDDPDDGMPLGSFYTCRGFWRRLEGNKLLWEKGLVPSDAPLPPPKPQRTFQYQGTGDRVPHPAQWDGSSSKRLTDARGSRKARPPNFPPPPCPLDKTNGLSRHNGNRKSFEYEDASQMAVKRSVPGEESRQSGLYHAYSDDNIYEDIVCEGPRDGPYEDVKLSPMCLPIDRPRPRPGTISQRSYPQGSKVQSKPQTMRDYSAKPARKMSSETLPPTVSAPKDGPKPASARRSATPKAQQQPQYISKIETIFDAKRGRKRVKNQGSAVREETSGTESDPEDAVKDSRRRVYVQSTLRRRPGYRTLEKDLIQLQQQQLFQVFVVVSLRKGSSGNSYSPEITQQFPKMFERPLRQSKDAEDRLKVIPKFCFPDSQDWRPASDAPSATPQNRKVLKGNEDKKVHVSSPSETFSFVLTGEDGSRCFCYCRKILPSGKGKRLPEVHCIVSQLGCFNLFAKILEEVERRREICPALVHPFMRSVMEAPFPAPGRTITVKNFLPGSGNEELTLCRPVDSRLEHVDFRTLLQCLSVDRLLQVFGSLLLERRVIFIADKLGVLSRCSHAVLALLYPFTWQHTFVPVLPASMLDISCSPTPFLMGALAPCLPQLLELPIEELLIVDLCADRFVVQLGDEDCILPSKLQAALQQILEERELILGHEGEDTSEDLSSLVSEAFVRFFVELVGHYPLYMAESTGGARELRRDAFRRSHPSRGGRQFLQLFMETQMFAGFIQDKELRKVGGGKGLFEARAAEYLESYPEPSGVNKFLKGLGSKIKFLQLK